MDACSSQDSVIKKLLYSIPSIQRGEADAELRRWCRQKNTNNWDLTSFVQLRAKWAFRSHMSFFCLIPRRTQIQPIIALVTNAVTSPHTKRAYGRALDDFIAWYHRVGTAGVSKATMAIRQKHPVRVVAADDSAVFRTTLIRFLTLFPNLEVIAQAANGREALQLVEELDPEILLLDIRMSGMDGIEVLRHLRAIATNVQVVVLSAQGELRKSGTGKRDHRFCLQRGYLSIAYHPLRTDLGTLCCPSGR
jgi:CheY-like chemotaxis protein